MNFIYYFFQIKLYHSAQLTLLTQKLVHSGPVATVKVIGNYIISGGIVINLPCPKLLTLRNQ